MTKDTDAVGPLRQPTPSELVSRSRCGPYQACRGTGDLTAVVLFKHKLVLDYLVHNCYTKTATALVETQLFSEGEDDEEDEFDEERIKIAEHRQGRKFPIFGLTNTFLISLSYLRDT